MNIIANKTSRSFLKQDCMHFYDSVIKAVVDTSRRVMAVDVQMHADAELELLEDGSEQRVLWGINLYPDKTEGEWIEFSSLINIRPQQANFSMGVDDPAIQEQIRSIVAELIDYAA